MMSKNKHQLSEHEYEIYQKIHKYEQPVEAEQGKIQREKSSYLEKREESQRKMKRLLEDWMSGDLDANDEGDLIDEQEFLARREISNARVHKNRLKSIEKFDDES